MSKTLLQLRTSFQAWLSIDQEDGSERCPDAIANDIINMVARDYLRRRESKLGEYSTVLNAVANTPDYTYPENFSKPRKIWYLDPTTSRVVYLEYLDKDTFDTKYPQSSLLTLDGAGALILAGGGALELEGGGELMLSGLIDLTNSLGLPTHYTMWMGKFVLGKCPDRELVMFVDHYRMLPDLAGDSDHNRFTDEAWEYLLFASLTKAAIFGFDVESERLTFFANEAKKFEVAMDLEDVRQHTVGGRSQSTEPG